MPRHSCWGGLGRKGNYRERLARPTGGVAPASEPFLWPDVRENRTPINSFLTMLRPRFTNSHTEQASCLPISTPARAGRGSVRRSATIIPELKEPSAISAGAYGPAGSCALLSWQYRAQDRCDNLCAAYAVAGGGCVCTFASAISTSNIHNSKERVHAAATVPCTHFFNVLSSRFLFHKWFRAYAAFGRRMPYWHRKGSCPCNIFHKI